MIVEVAVVGAGTMGANHARIISILPSARLAFVVDSDAERARHVAVKFGCSWSTDVSDLRGNADAAVIAVPTERHHEVTQAVIELGFDVLVEKPLAATLDEAADLVRCAEAAGRILAVGHVERFNPACLDLPRYVDKPHFVQTQRLSPYGGRIKEGVVRDLMIHDIDLILAIADSGPRHVTARTQTRRSATEDFATATVEFDSGLLAQMTVSRVAQSKVRTLDIMQDDSVVSVDLLRQDITIHRQAAVEYYGAGDPMLRESSIVEIPFLSRNGEPLWIELEDFVDAVQEGRRPLVDGRAGLAALDLCTRIIDAAQDTD